MRAALVVLLVASALGSTHCVLRDDFDGQAANEQERMPAGFQPNTFVAVFTASEIELPGCRDEVRDSLANLQAVIGVPSPHAGLFVTSDQVDPDSQSVMFQIPLLETTLSTENVDDPAESLATALNARFAPQGCAVFGKDEPLYITSAGGMLRGRLRGLRQRNTLRYQGRLEIVQLTYEERVETRYAIAVDGQRIALDLVALPTSAISELQTGMQLIVTGTDPKAQTSLVTTEVESPLENFSYSHLNVASVWILSQPENNVETYVSMASATNADATTPSSLSTLTVTLSICGATAINTTAIRDLWFSNSTLTMKSYFKTCSYGKMDFVGEVTEPISICPQNWNSTADIWAVQNATDASLEELGIDLSKYRTVIYIMTHNPNQTAPAPVGAGTKACRDGCRVWLRSDWWDQLEVPFHELGHNLGLNHAANGTDYYGDTSDVMGAAGAGPRCLNAPHLHQLGWANPILDLQGTALAPGIGLKIGLPPAVSTPTHFVRLNATVTGSGSALNPAVQPPHIVYYISYRTTLLPFDNPYPPRRVNVYNFSDTINAATATYWLASMAQGDNWTHVDTGLQLTVSAITNMSASITICLPDPNTGNCTSFSSTVPNPSPQQPSSSPSPPSSPLGPASPVLAREQVPPGVLRIGAAMATTSTSFVTMGPADVAVAVLDTGVDLTHSDLNVIDGTNCVTPNTPANDDNGHGTHVAGTIAAKNNGQGVIGVAPGTTIIAVKVVDSKGAGTWSKVICGLEWVLANAQKYNIKVVALAVAGYVGNRRFSYKCGTDNGDPLHATVCKLTAANISIVAAAGNGPQGPQDLETWVPARYPEVLAVTAMMDDDGKPFGLQPPPCSVKGSDDAYYMFSNYATTERALAHILAAPGVCVNGPYMGGGYTLLTGTSVAMPHVAGVVALCHGGSRRLCRDLLPAGVITTLRSQALTHAMVGRDRCPADCNGRSSNGFLGDLLNNSTVIPTPAGRMYGYLAWAGDL